MIDNIEWYYAVPLSLILTLVYLRQRAVAKKKEVK